jgi:hypothetical protein
MEAPMTGDVPPSSALPISAAVNAVVLRRKANVIICPSGLADVRVIGFFKC